MNNLFNLVYLLQVTSSEVQRTEIMRGNIKNKGRKARLRPCFLKFSKQENWQGLSNSKAKEIYTNPETKVVKLLFRHFICKALCQLPDI